MKIYAHRGYSGMYPENTMTAYRKAAERHPEGIELDVQLTKDGEVVVIHDEKVDRTTDGTGFVCEYTFAELEKLNAGRTHPETCTQEHIPSFDEYCEWLKTTDLVTNIELKSGAIYYHNLEDRTLAVIAKYGVEKQVFFSSFNPLSLVRMKKLAPEIPCGLLVEKPIINAGFMCKLAGFEFFHPGMRGLTEKTVGECHHYGIGVNVWTVNTGAEAEKLKQLGVDGIFSNYPAFTAD